MLSNEKILELINDKESDRIERTTSIDDTDKFAEAICAFSNDLANHQKPGYLFIGVHNTSCKLSGLKVTDNLLKNIAAIRSDGNILPQPAMTVEPYAFDDGDVIAVEVQPAHFPPVRYKGTIWIRVGPRRGIANEMEERLLTEKRTSNAKTFDERPCIGTTIDDLNINLFKMIYLPKAVSAATLANDNRDIKLQLASLRFYDLVYDCPTNAGILMFGNNVRYFFPMAYVQFVKFEGTTKASNIQADTQISGDLISIVNELNSFVRINIIKRRPIPISTLIEEDVYNYSESAVREFLMNSLMHRSYEITSYIKFYQFSDRVEIENPGGLYGNARPENFPNVSDYRNLVISESMRVMGYVNRFNRGIEEAQLALKNNKNKPAEFDFDTFGVFRVVIKEKPIEKIKASFSNPWDGVTIKDTDNEKDENNGGISGGINGGINGGISGGIKLSKTETEIIGIIETHENIKVDEICELFKMSKRTVERHLSHLKDLHIIEYVGALKTGGYKIKNNNR